jgi:hypothetical protein
MFVNEKTERYVGDHREDLISKNDRRCQDAEAHIAEEERGDQEQYIVEIARHCLVGFRDDVGYEDNEGGQVHQQENRGK